MSKVTVQYLDHMGSDLAVINAAKVSFDKESDWERGYDTARGVMYSRLSAKDTKLIDYLARHKHWTPFAHTAIKFRIGAPVPIRTQCFKHKMGFVENEESRRYISSRPELFIPDEFRTAPERAKQGSGGTHPRSDSWKKMYVAHCEQGINLYEAMIADGAAPEQARFVLPQGVIVNWIWSGNLSSFARFYQQRTDPHAQKETEAIAEKISKEMTRLFPVSWLALTGV